MSVQRFADRLVLGEVPPGARLRVRVVPGVVTYALHVEPGRPAHPMRPPEAFVYGSGPGHPDPRRDALEMWVTPEPGASTFTLFVVDADGALQAPTELGPPEVHVVVGDER
ncbi:MAG: hypothetical protein AAGH15_27090 [Myxococcota bacterium]